MQPNVSTVHVDRPLTNISVGYMTGDRGYIAHRVFPVVPVSKRSDKYFIYPKGEWFRDEAKKRAPSTESAGGDYTVSTDNYNCDDYAIHKDVDDQMRANYDNPLSPDREAVLFVTQRLLLRREKAFISDFLKTGVWATDKVGTTDFVKFDDYTTSDPRTVIKDARATILSSTGFKPNTLVLGYETKDALVDHPDIVDRIKYTSSQSVTPELLAKQFEVDRVLVSEGIENTAKEGAAASMGFTFAKGMWLGYVNPDPGLYSPSAGYTFSWDYAPVGKGTGMMIRRFRMEHLRSDRVEGELAFDDKLVGADLGCYFDQVVS